MIDNENNRTTVGVYNVYQHLTYKTSTSMDTKLLLHIHCTWN